MQLEIPTALDVGLTRTLAVLSAMITPAVLISACASLTISTSNRLTRTIARAREVSKLFEQLMDDPPRDEALLEEERDVLFHLLQRATRRSKILQRAMTSTYLAMGSSWPPAWSSASRSCSRRSTPSSPWRSAFSVRPSCSTPASF
jgi:hypothetical protein